MLKSLIPAVWARPTQVRLLNAALSYMCS
jgi:hypothetical protein